MKNDTTKRPGDPIENVGKVSAVVSFGLFVILGIKYVDGVYNRSSDTAVEQEIVQLESENRVKIEEFQANAASIHRELTDFELNTIEFQELTTVQDELLALSKRCNCTLKKAAPAEKQTLPFVLRSQPSETTNSGDTTSEQETIPYETPQCSLALSVAGDLDSITRYLAALRDKPWITTTSQLSLRRDPATSGGMSMEMELVFWSLRARAPK
jgi:hypothetical protein